MLQTIAEIRRAVRQDQPLIHCITNPISINQCANAILAVGGRPIMAEHPGEAAEITRSAHALMLNLGNITDARMESIRSSAETAREHNIPFLLDVVGIACSGLRREYAGALLKTAVPTLVKGNYSEILALHRADHRSSGVDADPALELSTVSRAAASLARRLQTVILASGRVDIVTDGLRMYHIRNGTPQLSRITGTGCMLGALCASYLAGKADLDAAVTGCAVLGICGELARTELGTGTFLCRLMDTLSTLTEEELAQYLNLEEMQHEPL